MWVDGAIGSFAPFNNAICQTGFLYFNQDQTLRMGTLPERFSYDAPMPVFKIPLRTTAHSVWKGVEEECGEQTLSDSLLQPLSGLDRLPPGESYICAGDTRSLPCEEAAAHDQRGP